MSDPIIIRGNEDAQHEANRLWTKNGWAGAIVFACKRKHVGRMRNGVVEILGTGRSWRLAFEDADRGGAVRK